MNNNKCVDGSSSFTLKKINTKSYSIEMQI